MDETIIAKQSASAAVLGSKIFYCGGLQRDSQEFNSCHSYVLGKEKGGRWQEEPSMVESRSNFGQLPSELPALEMPFGGQF